jgi:hypothetical protein
MQFFEENTTATSENNSQKVERKNDKIFHGKDKNARSSYFQILSFIALRWVAAPPQSIQQRFAYFNFTNARSRYFSFIFQRF